MFDVCLLYYPSLDSVRQVGVGTAQSEAGTENELEGSEEPKHEGSSYLENLACACACQALNMPPPTLYGAECYYRRDRPPSISVWCAMVV